MEINKAIHIPKDKLKAMAKRKPEPPRPATPIHSSGDEIPTTTADTSGAWDPTSQTPGSMRVPQPLKQKGNI